MNYDDLLISSQEQDSICYDVVYALRLCAEQDLHEACIQIYTTMQLYNEAVEQALKVGSLQFIRIVLTSDIMIVIFDCSSSLQLHGMQEQCSHSWNHYFIRCCLHCCCGDGCHGDEWSGALC